MVPALEEELVSPIVSLAELFVVMLRLPLLFVNAVLITINACDNIKRCNCRRCPSEKEHQNGDRQLPLILPHVTGS